MEILTGLYTRSNFSWVFHWIFFFLRLQNFWSWSLDWSTPNSLITLKYTFLKKLLFPKHQIGWYATNDMLRENFEGQNQDVRDAPVQPLKEVLEFWQRTLPLFLWAARVTASDFTGQLAMSPQPRMLPGAGICLGLPNRQAHLDMNIPSMLARFFPRRPGGVRALAGGAMVVAVVESAVPNVRVGLHGTGRVGTCFQNWDCGATIPKRKKGASGQKRSSLN